MKPHCMIAAALLACSIVHAQTPPYKNPRLPVEQRVLDLLSRMTTEEKINQLRSDGDPKVFGQALGTTGWGFIPLYNVRGRGPVKEAEQLNEWQKTAQGSRLGIPVMPYDESLHGSIAPGHTSFPQAIAFAATWDPALIHRVAADIADENRNEGIRQVLSPVINVCRDARWGRMEESYGEDPLLTSDIAVAFVTALEKAGVVTTPKHYVANLWDGGRDSNAVEISKRSLFDIYMEPFRACFQEGGSRSVMCSYNAVNGVPCASDHWLETDILRGQWGFKGYVVSDWGATNNVLNAFHVASDEEHAAAALVNAGMDAEHPTVNIYGKGLEDAVAHGLISKANLDQAVGRVLRVKFEIGLFDNPFVDPAKALAEATNAEHTALARETAEKSMVLLKNHGNVLPLSPNYKRIAVFGDMVEGQVPLGGYSGTGNRAERKSILQGLKDHSPGVEFTFTKGCNFGSGSAYPAIPTSALTTPDGQPGLKAEFWTNQELSGTPAFTRTDPTIDFDWENDPPAAGFQTEHYSARWSGFLTAPQSGDYDISGTSDDGIRIWINNVVVAEDWSDHSASTAQGHVYLKAGEKVPIRVDYFQNGGQAEAKVGWKLRGEPDALAHAVQDAASNADCSLVFVGIREGEGQDRAYINLPGNQEEVIKAAARSGKPVIVVLVAGAPVTMEGWIDQVPAILDTWYPGQEGADAIARVLFGDVNPSGKLPMTFPKTVGQCPLYYNYEPTGRGYDYVNSSGAPLFPFGHGLSYTTFEYSNLKLNAMVFHPDGPAATVTFEVKNTGTRPGAEVPQLYVYEETASVLRPLKSLKAFTKIVLQPGESKSVSFTLTKDKLALTHEDLKRVFEAGNFDFMVGSSSGDIRLKGKLQLPSGGRLLGLGSH